MTEQETQLVEKLRNKLFETHMSLSELKQIIDDEAIPIAVRHRAHLGVVEVECHCVDIQDMIEELSNVSATPTSGLKTMLTKIFTGKSGE